MTQNGVVQVPKSQSIPMKRNGTKGAAQAGLNIQIIPWAEPRPAPASNPP